MDDGKDRSSIFISYSHRDAEWLARLRVHLRPLERDFPITVWDDTMIEPGTHWREAIESSLTAAKVVILLVSADFLASDFIASDELPRILKGARSAGVLVLPVIVSPSRFARTPGLSDFQTANDPARPLISLSRGEQEGVLVQLSERIEAALAPPPRPKASARPAQPAHPAFPGFVAKLRELSKAREGSFLVASVGAYYVQFLAPQDGEAWMEASESKFLPQGEELSPREHARLEAMGFEPPGEGETNFHRTVALSGEAAIAEAATLSLRVLTEVFGRALDATVEFELNLEDEAPR